MHIASRYLDAEDLTNVRSLVSDSREALDRLANLTRQIVAASHNEEPEIQLEILSLNECLHRVATWAQTACQAKKLQFVLEPCEGDDRVLANKEAMNSVLTNLISNAVRYTPANGRIEVTSRSIDGEICVTVRDTGIGMSPEVQARIFDKFFRAPGAKKMESGGLGMGLAITAKLVQAQGGRIEVSSQPNQGSIFTVKFPAHGKED
jgi:two-component system phosphate regulon sensor histidine kinase PhoR